MKKSGKLSIEEDCIIMEPKITAASHKHKMPHILVSREPFELFLEGSSVRGRTALIAADTEHFLTSIPEETKMLLVLPLTDLYFEIQKLTQGRYFVTEEYVELNELLKQLQKTDSCSKNEITDSRILEVVTKIREGEFLDLTVKEISEKVNLSPSRLEHLFTGEAGITIKHYLLICRMKKALEMVDCNKSVTFSAIEAGFSDSSHLASAIKRLAGVSISEVFKNNL